MPRIFEDFDLANFWEDSDYARKSYVNDPLSPGIVGVMEQELGFRLPASYVELMTQQNGGIPRNTRFPTSARTTWSNDRVAIEGIYGIGWEKPYSLGGEFGSRFMQEEWGYPEIGICICDCPSAGHDMIMLDYRKCGPAGEPEVVHVDQESNYRITFLAKDFETFVRGLVNESVYDTSAEDLKDDLKKIESGSFSSSLTRLVAGEPGMSNVIRKLLRELAIEKGYFSLHADERSLLVYDLLFYLYVRQNPGTTRNAYETSYPTLIAFGDGDITTGGYAPGFISKWMDHRLNGGEIVATADGEITPSNRFIQSLLEKLEGYK